jgi:hypothetical protein
MKNYLIVFTFSNTDKSTRILQALVISMYREQIAINHQLNIKPVILLKTKPQDQRQYTTL